MPFSNVPWFVYAQWKSEQPNIKAQFFGKRFDFALIAFQYEITLQLPDAMIPVLSGFPKAYIQKSRSPVLIDICIGPTA